MTNEVVPMPHELRTQLNNELNAQKELIAKLTELESQFTLALNRLKQTVNKLMNVKVDFDPADAVDLEIKLSKEEKPICKKCGSTLIDDGYGEVNACTNCA